MADIQGNCGFFSSPGFISMSHIGRLVLGGRIGWDIGMGLFGLQLGMRLLGRVWV